MNRPAALLLDIFYPNRCDCCGERIPYDALLCEPCKARLDALRISAADWDSGSRPLPWKSAALLYAYDGAARTGVLAMKDGRRGFCAYAAKQLAPLIPPEITCITYVPVAKSRRRIQGYAHAESLAKYLAAELHLPVRGDLLTETAGKTRQHDLPAAEREQYAARFLASGKRIDGETVLLTDDILTTGATLRHCTKLLLDAGAESVHIAAVCAGIRQKAENG